MQIPFERTIIGAYRFGTANYLSILGIAWLPFLLLLAAAALLVMTALPELGSLLAMGADKWDESRVAAFANTRLVVGERMLATHVEPPIHFTRPRWWAPC